MTMQAIFRNGRLEKCDYIQRYDEADGEAWEVFTHGGDHSFIVEDELITADTIGVNE